MDDVDPLPRADPDGVARKSSPDACERADGWFGAVHTWEFRVQRECIPSDRADRIGVGPADKQLVRGGAKGAGHHLPMVNGRGEIGTLLWDQRLLCDVPRNAEYDVVFNLGSHQPSLRVIEKRLWGRLTNNVQMDLSPPVCRSLFPDRAEYLLEDRRGRAGRILADFLLFFGDDDEQAVERLARDVVLQLRVLFLDQADFRPA